MADLTKVLSAYKSPMNARRWLVALECGHETWVTASRKPQRLACPDCAQREACERADLKDAAEALGRKG